MSNKNQNYTFPEKSKSSFPPAFVKLVESTKRPAHAFVLLAKEKVVNEGGEKKIKLGMMTVNVGDQPGQIYALQDAYKRGARIVMYGNFPSGNGSDDERKLYESHGKGNNNAFAKLKSHCEMLLNDANTNAAKIAEAVERAEEAESKAKSFAEQLDQEIAKSEKLKKELAAQKAKATLQSTSTRDPRTTVNQTGAKADANKDKQE